MTASIRRSLALDPDDFHPNAMGHNRLAHRLDLAMKGLPELGQLWSTEESHASFDESAVSQERSAKTRGKPRARFPSKTEKENHNDRTGNGIGGDGPPGRLEIAGSPGGGALTLAAGLGQAP